MGHTPRADAPVPAVQGSDASQTASTNLPREVDVLIVGAGLSGINAAYRVQTETNLSYAVAEARHDLGGTWEFFKYAGIRSDSDLYTLGFDFSVFRGKDPIADGPAIYQYIKTTAKENGIYDKISFNSRAGAASWSTAEARWTVQIQGPNGQPAQSVKCRFLYWCSGYYSYSSPYKAPIKGLHDGTFAGQIVHPQAWDENLDWTNKRVVLIGSGATAVTLLPAMAPKAEHVTMLQRSPSYYVAMPRADPIAWVLKFILPEKWAHSALRYIWAVKYNTFYRLCRAFPNAMRKVLSGLARWHLGKEKHKELGQPRYKPWDQRICFVPDGDAFAAMRSGKASVVTDTIDTVTKHGIKLSSGKELAADIIVPCTGLKVEFFGGADITVDGQKIRTGDKFIYKGFLLQDVPNMCMSFGYTTISWSLGSDVTARHVCRLLNRMLETGKDWVVPQAPAGTTLEESQAVNLNSGYLQRAKDTLPKAATQGPWYMRSNWFKDRKEVERDTLDECLTYGNASGKAIA